MKLFEVNKNEESEDILNFELELEVSNHIYELIKGVVESNLNNDLFVLNEDMSSKITITPKSSTSIVLYIRDEKSGGRSNSDSQHSSSLKILKPTKYKGVSIMIPKNGKELEIKSNEHNEEDVRRDLKPAIEFTEKNAKILDILWSSADKPWKQKKALNQIVSKNKDITNITVDGKIKNDIEDKLKRKIDERK